MELPESEFILDVDTVVIAVGHNPNSLISRGIPDMAVNKDGTIYVNELNGLTSLAGVFAAGNVKTNAGPVVEAMASGQLAAEQIDQYLK
jgi:glutamate synthase (NADPH/NADH) small chain